MPFGFLHTTSAAAGPELTARHKTAAKTLEVTDGTLYPVLYRLERAGFVAVRWETPQRGVPRKYYRLTTAGEEELARLTYEWNTFASAMARLLRQQPETT